MSGRPVFTQTRRPLALQSKSFQRDPNRHYLLVEEDRGDYESMADFFLAEMIDQSGESPYVNHGYVAGECPSKKQMLFSCSKSFYEWVLRRNASDAQKKIQTPETIRARQVTVEAQKPVSIDGLNQIQLRDAATGYPMRQQG